MLPCHSEHRYTICMAKKSKKKNRSTRTNLLMGFGLIVFFVISLFIIHRLQRTTPQLTADIQMNSAHMGTYVNNRGKYQLSLPAGYQVLWQHNASESATTSQIVKRIDRQFPSMTIYSSDTNPEMQQASFSVDHTWQKVDLNGIETQTSFKSDDENEYILSLLSDRENPPYIMLSQQLPKLSDQYADTQKQILSTFKYEDAEHQLSNTYHSPKIFPSYAFKPFSLDYPDGWTLSVYQGDFSLQLRKQQHNLVIKHSQLNPSVCRFADRPIPPPPFDTVPNIKIGFGEITAGDISYRRINTSTYDTLCELLPDEQQYTTPAKAGLIVFEYPEKVDPIIRAEMDQIISTFRYQ